MQDEQEDENEQEDADEQDDDNEQEDADEQDDYNEEEISDAVLMTIETVDLNRRMRGFSRQKIDATKDRRRTLKNRR